MLRARTIHLLVPAVAVAAACSSGGGTGAGGAATGTSSATGTSAVTTTATGATSTGSTTVSGSTTGSTTTSSGTTTTTGATTSSTSSGMAGACTDAADTAKIAAIGASQLQTDVTNCATQNLGGEPATKNCITTKTMLSAPCVTCFDNNVQCAVQNCFAQCSGGMSAGCTACLHTNCTPAFNTCSGLMGP